MQASSGTLGLALPAFKAIARQTMLQRTIPVSGELIPAVGLGTWQTFDVGNNMQARAGLKQVLQVFVDGGGKVVDTSPMYGSSESVLGDLASELNILPDLFMASKIWTRGQANGVSQMQQSMQRMKTARMDLMQIHNLVDAKTHLQTLSNWKREGKIRYLGVTHYHRGGYAQMKQIMLAQPIDFIQINYSIASRAAEQDLLPLAKDKGIAVLINRPFEAGSLFEQVRNTKLPGWASDFGCSSWGQFFLKFILANDAVTCVIPGTSKVRHMRDNLLAGQGPLPNHKQARAMLAYMLDA